MSKKSRLIIIGAGVSVIVLPFVVDWIIIGNSIPSNISNTDWVGFLGGYIGAIIGCIISFAGIFWTINFTREQNRADRELQIRPFFDIRYNDIKQTCYTESWLGYVAIDARNKKEAGENTASSKQVGAGLLYLKNVGNGPATNISFQVSIESTDTEYRGFFTNKNSKVSTNSIRPNEQAELSIDITNSKKAPTKDDVMWVTISDFDIPQYDEAKFKAPESFVLTLTLCYDDLMQNHFVQDLVFEISYYLMPEKEQDSYYHCNANLKSIGVPTITRL